MTITAITIYETDDGKQHKTFEAAQHWARRAEVHAFVENLHDLTREEKEGVCNFFDIIDAGYCGKSALLASHLRELADKLEPIKVEEAK